MGKEFKNKAFGLLIYLNRGYKLAREKMKYLSENY